MLIIAAAQIQVYKQEVFLLMFLDRQCAEFGRCGANKSGSAYSGHAYKLFNYNDESLCKQFITGKKV